MEKLLAPDFLIVGTPRSGTTLVQRLVSEHPDCRVPPETHFFVHCYPRLKALGVTFPIQGSQRELALRVFESLPSTRGLAFNVEDVIRRGGNAAWMPLEMFGAIVRSLSGDSRFVGEKTPDHLMWWKPITRADGCIKVIWVVRDPRGVASSMLRVPWGLNSADLIARRWSLDMKSLERASKVLGPRRLLKVRFEDVVGNPTALREEIWRFLDLPHVQSGRPVFPHMLRRSDEVWKEQATGPVISGRGNAWLNELSPDHQALVESICRQQMKQDGYYMFAATTRPTVHASRLAKHGYMVSARLRKQAWIERQRL